MVESIVNRPFCYSEADAIGKKTDWHPNKRMSREPESEV